MSHVIYQGLWIDWTMGRWLGATITLSSKNGALLLAFIAAFVTVVSSRLWRIISFILHQIHATDTAHDGLHFQRQHTLRNVASPAAAANTILLQLWYWRHTKRVVWRTLPWAIVALLYIGVFAVLAIFSSRVSSSASLSRLVLPDKCGIWEPQRNLSMDDRVQLDMEKTAYDVTHAVGNARSCYSSSSTSLGCDTFPVPMLDSEAVSVTCPFGDDICFGGQAYQIKTKSIDSQNHLGINARPEDRIIYNRQMTCAPLLTKGYGRYANDTDGEPVSIQYFYGPQPIDSLGNKTNYTYEFPLIRGKAEVGYQVSISEYRLGKEPAWQPIEALYRKGGDTFIIFVEQNSVLHWKRNKDPVFAANRPNTNRTDTAYLADRSVSPIACFQQHNFCTPKSDHCSSWGGRWDMLNLTTQQGVVGFTATQAAVAARISFASLTTSLYESINSQSSKCLRAQDRMDWLFQMPLPDDQWKLEVLAWAQEGLASLQAAVVEYAAGPTIALDGAHMQPMWLEKTPSNYTSVERAVNKAWKDMCHSQIVRDTQGTLNFSLLGVALIFGLGIWITILSFVVEPLTAWIQTSLNIGVARAAAWQRDDGLQTLRLLFESHRRGAWRGSASLVPVTVSADEAFLYPEASAYGVVKESYQAVPNTDEEHYSIKAAQ
jgi:hypothetical protein